MLCADGCLLCCSDYCEAGFATRTLGDHVITFTREGNVEFGCDFREG